MKTKKDWGTVTEHGHIDRIQVKADSYCSIHYHEKLSNEFEVIKGCLAIEYMLEGRVCYTVLVKGMKFSLPPGIVHRFVAQEDTVAIERYFGPADRTDIIRLADWPSTTT